MAGLDITENGWRTRATYVSGIGYSELNTILAVVSSFREAVPLDRFKFELTAGSAYDYRIWLLDGRVWKQTITFAAPDDIDPAMTFDVEPAWMLTEFQSHRDIRSLMVSLRAVSGLSLFRVDPA